MERGSITVGGLAGRRNRLIRLMGISAVVSATAWPQIALPQEEPAYRNSALPPPERALDLLYRMTLEEKVGQMTKIYMAFLVQDSDVAAYNIGSLFGPEGTGLNIPLSWARLHNRYQKIAVENTRLGIPLLFGTDAIHGSALLLGAVTFPHHIGMGSTWNPALVERCAHLTAVRRTGQEPINYDVRPGEPYDPLFEFGYGLSYTTFVYENLAVSPSLNVSAADRVLVSVEVSNTGSRLGSEVVQVYANELQSSLSTLEDPRRLLAGKEPSPTVRTGVKPMVMT
ncbi:MAG: hypothetical protein HY717_22055 [Planctomycetes bacterium]|nr:hypothetical protein [Planctomycetota bacterium]